MFSNNDRALLFGKGIGNEPIIDIGKRSQANAGEKLTATDPTTGDLLFYSDGVNIFDASHQIMQRGDGINADVTGIQSMAVSPIPGPGNEGRFYLFTKNGTGEIFYTIVNMNFQGNRTTGPVLGGVELGQRNQPTGITGRGQAMITVGSRDMTSFWLITQNAASGDFEVFSIDDGEIFTSESILNTTLDITSEHFAYNNQSARIAVVPSNNVNIQILAFDEVTQSLRLETAIANSFVLNESFGGSAGWSVNGTKVYFSRNGATDGNVYRYDLNDPMATVTPVLPSAVPESLSLMVAPDSSLYHIYRPTVGGDRILGRFSLVDFTLDTLQYESDVLTGQDFASDYFQQFLPERRIAPTVDFTFQEPCMNNPTLFFPIITPPEAQPDSFLWDFQGSGQMSNQRSPIVTFDQAGTIVASVLVEINGLFYQSAPQIIDVLNNDLQVQLQDTTICPGETLELDAEPEDQGGGGGGGAGTTYTYRWSTGETTPQINVTEAGDYWVVVTPASGCPVYASAEVTVYGDENRTANIWYFGNGAGVDFNEEDGLDPPPRSITTAHAMDAPEGTSTISDANGQVLFYTDGSTVYNNLDLIMENGEDIGGDVGSTQSVIIVPFQDDETLYYIFTTQEVYGSNEYLLKYSIVDMKEGDGLGEVTVKDQQLFSKSTEKLAAIEAGGGHWVLSHDYGSNTFRAYAITPEGISNPVLSSVGSVHSLNDALSGQAGMKFSNTADRVAVALIEGSDDYVELFAFDQTTGEVSELEYVIDLNEGDAGVNDEVYDVHFSPGGIKLFASLNNRNSGTAGGRILEYRVDSFSTAATRQLSKADLTANVAGNFNYGGIQTGPDGQIYVAVESPGNPAATAFLSSIAANEDTLTTSFFNLQQVALTVGNSRLGLPNFVQNSANPIEEPSISAPDTTCVEEVIELSASGTSDIDMFLWTIQDQSNNVVFSALAQDTSYTFPTGQSGNFELSLNIFNRCGYDTTFVQTLDVFEIPDPPTVPAAIALCEGQNNLLTAGPVDPVLSYVWTNSQGAVVSTSNTYDVTEEEIYTVTINNVAGCSSTAEIFVGPPFEIGLPPDQTICQDGSLTLDSNITADNYVWTRINPDNSTVTLPNQRTAEVDASTPGVYQYIVSIEDPITAGCFVNDTTNVTINPLPQMVVSSITNTSCGSQTGAIDLNVTTTGSYSYQLIDNGGATVQSDNNFTGPGPLSLTGLAAGVYSIAFTDNSSTCSNTFSGIEIVDTTSDVNIDSFTTVDAACGSSDGSMTITLNSAAVYPISFTLTNTSDPSVTPISGNRAAPISTTEFEITGVPGATYDLEVISAGGCTDTQTGITINVPTDVDLTVTTPVDVCGVSADVTVSSTTANVSYSWTGPNGFSGTGPTITARESGTFIITASAPGFCDVTENIEVNLTIQPTVVINRIGDTCTGELTLEAEVTNPQPGASYIYTWSTGEQSRQITVTADGSYDVVVRQSNILNCESATVVENVTFPENLEATISSEPACDDGQPIEISVDILSGNPTNFAWSRNGTAISGSGSTISVTDEGDYTVRISQGSCFIERSIVVRRNSIPEGLLPDEEFYCPTRTTPLVLTAGFGFDTYEWTLDGAPIANTERSIEISSPGTYAVTMTTAFVGALEMIQ